MGGRLLVEVMSRCFQMMCHVKLLFSVFVYLTSSPCIIISLHNGTVSIVTIKRG